MIPEININKKNNILLFIPTYNECENIEKLIEEININFVNCDILITDDNSPDGTGDILKKLTLKYFNLNISFRPKRMGIGSAHKQALFVSKKMGYDFLITMDADFTHDPKDINLLFKQIKENGIVIGARFKNKNSLEDWDLFRIFLTKLGHFATKRLLLLPYDSTAAFRVYSLKNIPIELYKLISSNNYDFFFESLIIFNLLNFKIKEVAFKFPSRRLGKSKMRLKYVFQSIIKLFILSLKIRFFRKNILKQIKNIHE